MGYLPYIANFDLVDTDRARTVERDELPIVIREWTVNIKATARPQCFYPILLFGIHVASHHFNFALPDYEDVFVHHAFSKNPLL